MAEFVSISGSLVIFAALYFEVFLLISLFERKKSPLPPADYTPEVTVIIPVYNEEGTVESTLESLFALDYPQENLSIIVVNDGSTDGTAAVLEKYKDNPQIKIFSKENGGKYTALNFGIEKSTTAYIGCLDADSFVEKHALRRIMSRFAEPSVMAVTPSMIIDKPKGLIRHMQKAEYNFGNFMRKALSLIGAIHITPGPFSFFRRGVFDTIGLYKHAHNTEDMEMAMRMQKNKMRIANATDALVYTVGPGSIGKLYKQRVRWVSGFIGNLIDYRDMLFSKQFGDLGLLVLPFSIFGMIMTFIFISISIYKFIGNLTEAIVRYSTVGFAAPKITFDWFYLNTSILSILSMMFVALIIALSLYGERTASGKWRFSMSVLYFTFLYSFIAPFWLLTSIYNNVFSKEASWR
jgi:cellulose synthase/poly-beta-1,6-N-acetylglucosamine synthase-like glycosyltransferase